MKKWPQLFQLNPLQTFQLMRFATTLLIGIVLAKVFGLSTGEIAIYEVLLFIGNFLSFFWISAGIKSLLSEFSRIKNQQISLFINIAFLLLIFGIIAGSLLYFSQDIIVQQFTQYNQLQYISLISLFLIFNSPAALIEYIYLLQKKEQQILWYGLIIFLLQLLSIIFPLLFNWGIGGIFRCLLIWSIFKFTWLIILLSQSYVTSTIKTPLTFNWLLQKKILLLIFPLSLHMLIGGGMEYIDGFIVSSYFEDTGMFAIFRYGAKELPLVTILTAALTATLIPLVVENQAIAIPKIKTEVEKLSRWLFPLTMVLMLLSPYLFPLVYTSNFAESAKVFNIYLLIISSRLLLPQVIIFARQHNYVLVWSAIIEVIINLCLSLYFVREYGLEGIAFATVIAYLVNKIILIAYNYFAFHIPLGDYLNIKRFLFYNVVLGIVFWMSQLATDGF